jgi:hypothetical protein
MLKLGAGGERGARRFGALGICLILPNTKVQKMRHLRWGEGGKAKRRRGRQGERRGGEQGEEGEGRESEEEGETES